MAYASFAQSAAARRMPRAVRLACVLALAVACAVAVSAGAFTAKAFAATAGVWTATTNPTYQNPVTGQIEDAAGSSNVALAESMVSGVTYPSALVEQDVDGSMYVTMRFQLASQVSSMTFEPDNGGDGAFGAAAATVMQTDPAADTADYRIPVANENSIIRVSMFVVPMGRDVVFFESLSNFVEGNADTFVQSVDPSAAAPAAEEPAPAAEEPAAESASSASSDTAAAGAAASAGAAAGEEAPSTGDAENKGVQAFNADGQEVTSDQKQAEPLSGATIGIIIAVAAVVIVVIALIVYFASVKPKRAKQAAAAQAAAAAAAAAAKPRVPGGIAAPKPAGDAPAAAGARPVDAPAADAAHPAGASQDDAQGGPRA